MRDKIHLLPDSVANQIAAGEVIQRPASVVKELVENAVDAGADNIRVIIRDAGKTLIQVIDNGSGMSATDTRMAFERHATSKIASANDLFTLQTMGFRGEALPSICAVSMVEVKSRQKGSPIGTRLIINGSKVESQEAEVCEEGTNMMVKNLFFNVPARRKFLKSDNVELSNIYREFERLALVNPGLAMSLDTGGKVVNLKKGTFRQRIAELWRGSLDSQLIPVETDTSIVKISGFVTRPEFARRRNALQYLIVNGRNMKHPYFHRAIVNCFNSLIAPDTMPCYFIKFEVDPASIDVNIHPTKNEIKFEEENLIWSILSAAVRGSLGKYSAVPTIDFEQEVLPIQPLREGETPQNPDPGIPLDYNPFDVKPAAGGSVPRHDHEKEKVKGWEQLYKDFIGEKKKESKIEVKSEERDGGELLGHPLPASLCLQYAEKYIVTTSRNGIVIIDQHRAHVKILFEQLMRRSVSDISASQTLMFPEEVEIAPELELLLTSAMPGLRSLGLIIEKDDAGSYFITGVPPLMKDSDPRELMLRILEGLSEDNEGLGLDKSEDPTEILKKKAALSMARSMAVRKGNRLTPEEMEEIIGELFKLPDPSFAPNGRRIFTTLDESFIAGLLP